MKFEYAMIIVHKYMTLRLSEGKGISEETHDENKDYIKLAF